MNNKPKTVELSLALSIVVALISGTYTFAQSSAKTDAIEDKVDAFSTHYSSKQEEFVELGKDVAVLKQQAITAKEDREEIKTDLREVLTILRAK